MSHKGEKTFIRLVTFSEYEPLTPDIIDFPFEENVCSLSLSNFTDEQDPSLDGFPILEENFFRIQRTDIIIIALW